MFANEAVPFTIKSPCTTASLTVMSSSRFTVIVCAFATVFMFVPPAISIVCVSRSIVPVPVSPCVFSVDTSPVNPDPSPVNEPVNDPVASTCG